MSYLLNNEQKMYDIIFANKNKNYGAYVIRSSYGKTMLKSISLMAFFFGSVMGFAFYMSHLGEPDGKPESKIFPIQEIDSTIYTMVDLTEQKKEPETPVRRQNNPPQSSDNLNNVVVSDSVSVENTTVNITNAVTSAGTESGTVSNPLIPGGGGGGKDEGGEGGKDGDDKPQDLISVDSQPEYEGGLGALLRFIATNVRYPEEAKEAGKEGVLYVKFVVDETGKVISPEAQNHLGYGLDGEGLRVVGKIPPFKKPGFKSGKAVKVYFQVPIRYRLR